jgi:hypothetical protein
VPGPNCLCRAPNTTAPRHSLPGFSLPENPGASK